MAKGQPMGNASTNRQYLKVPGLPCPDCSTPIVVDPILLLSAMPIACPGCGLELKVNAEQSAETLNALGGYMEAFAGVESGLAQKTAAFCGAEPKEAGARRGRRPRRRSRRRG